MYLVKLYVTHKPSILDPQGEAIKKALHNLNHNSITSITQDKYFEIKIDANCKEDAEKVVKKSCEELLVNQNMETSHYEIKEV
ncbi:phosphoribosylformylglycinamidine synthase subunit PurS [Apilactobacillus apisilvae]|uniref:Phosphoribosylformylglycinamidine synthase subunit PurS n=1 Tax=Apilactobacillus apisilvae TaxID=2923364 RepID=A0ABY4PJ53_9LACO|nr:phosphoribosylformylglycinamidine synthase subunit PurS [Apilactobacillus apisilvae]UQS85392.1 phosphoribosylformylglycinamidine synthase subunit PurS [Apilactobacillus apisilvae]